MLFAANTSAVVQYDGQKMSVQINRAGRLEEVALSFATPTAHVCARRRRLLSRGLRQFQPLRSAFSSSTTRPERPSAPVAETVVNRGLAWECTGRTR
jgi:hypothetical protein